MSSRRTLLVLAAATFVSGTLAGAVIDRAIVGGSAWSELGVESWAQYSRYADLGAGLVLYPLQAIGAAILVVAATVSYHLDRSAPRRAAIPLYAAVAFSAIGLLLTLKAAPIMLSLRTAQSAEVLQGAFDDFHFWGLYLRGTSDALAFIAEIWALTAMSRHG